MADNEIVPRSQMVKQGMVGIGGVVGGIAILALSGIGFWASLILGGIVAAIGLAVSSKKEDRMTGLITLGAGGLLMLRAVPFI